MLLKGFVYIVFIYFAWRPIDSFRVPIVSERRTGPLINHTNYMQALKESYKHILSTLRNETFNCDGAYCLAIQDKFNVSSLQELNEYDQFPLIEMGNIFNLYSLHKIECQSALSTRSR